MPEPEKSERDPPETVISDSVKSEDASESVKVSVAVSPALRDETSDETATVGLTVSTESVRVLLESEPSWLVLPAASEKASDAMEMTPSLVLLFVGVKVAV